MGKPPFWRTLEESCKGLGSVSLKINNQHTHCPQVVLKIYFACPFRARRFHSDRGLVTVAPGVSIILGVFRSKMLFVFVFLSGWRLPFRAGYESVPGNPPSEVDP